MTGEPSVGDLSHGAEVTDTSAGDGADTGGPPATLDAHLSSARQPSDSTTQPGRTHAKGRIGGRSRRATQLLLTGAVDVAAIAAALALVGGPRWNVTVALAAAFLLGVHALVPHPFATLGGHLGRRWVTVAAAAGGVSLVASVLVPSEAATIAALAVAALLGVGIGRTALRLLALLLRRRGIWLERTIIVGAGEVGQEMAQALLRRRDFGLKPIGFVDDIADTPVSLPLLGTPLGLREALIEHEGTTILLAFGPVKDPELVHRIRHSVEADPIRVFALPRFFELGVTKHAELDTLWGYPLVELSPPAHRRATWRLKRVVDVVTAATFLTLLAPLFGIIALAVKRSGPGPLIFRQERVSMQGERIEVMKFRTMAPNSDSDVTWQVDNDDRVTRVGRILRPTHLDELPQLINVLRGEMSIVGPRPERPHFVRQFNEEIHDYRHRHRVPAGLTGLAQVNGLWGDTSIRDRSRLDNRYIEDWSLLTDLRILGRTLGTLTGARANEDEDQATGPAASPAAPSGEVASVPDAPARTTRAHGWIDQDPTPGCADA